MRGALLVCGTGSDAGKSVVVAGLCRWLSRLGVRVAPFKAQNMALNSVVTADGGEIGRAQAAQAAAARVPARAAMNPVLLKPGGERTSHVVVRGRAYADVDAVGYRAHKPALLQVALGALAELRAQFDVVVCEGAGSPAEVNLRDGDIANMGLATAAGLPVVVVGDIDRGGVFAHLAGTVAVLDPADQRHVAGFVVNKFRGDPALLRPGLDWLERTTGRPCLGVLPWTPGLWLDAEDSLDLAYRPTAAAGTVRGGLLRVAVVRLPRMSNVGDVDPLTVEPGVAVRVTTSAAEVMDADLAVLPGTRATVHDLEWLRATGLADAVLARAAAGRPVLGVCGGLQMLGRQIVDEVESGRGSVPGLSLLDVTTTFHPDKTLALTTGEWRGQPVSGFVIQHGRVLPGGDEPFLGGCRSGAVAGTPWHGIFENDGFRRAFLTEVARATGSSWVASQTRFADVREARLDTLADLVETHLDTAALRALVQTGVPDALPRLSLGRHDERAPAVAVR